MGGQNEVLSIGTHMSDRPHFPLKKKKKKKKKSVNRLSHLRKWSNCHPQTKVMCYQAYVLNNKLVSERVVMYDMYTFHSIITRPSEQACMISYPIHLTNCRSSVEHGARPHLLDILFDIIFHMQHRVVSE